MSYELTYEDGNWYVWSTVVDDYISGPLDSPREVAEFILNRHPGEISIEGVVPYTNEKMKKIYDIWCNEALKVRRNPEEGLQIIGSFELTSEGELKGKKFEEPFRMTPKLRELKRKREGD